MEHGPAVNLGNISATDHKYGLWIKHIDHFDMEKKRGWHHD